MSTDNCTLGVAIAIPEPWGDDLQEQRAAYGDRLAWTIPTHITLLPPTQVSSKRLRDVDEHLRSLADATEPFQLTLGRSDTFRPVTQTVFLTVTEGRSACLALERRVRQGPLQRRLPFPYHPHVTLALDVPDDVLDKAMADYASFEASFPVTTLTRYDLGEEGLWQPEREFAFGG